MSRWSTWPDGQQPESGETGHAHLGDFDQRKHGVGSRQNRLDAISRRGFLTWHRPEAEDTTTGSATGWQAQFDDRATADGVRGADGPAMGLHCDSRRADRARPPDPLRDLLTDGHQAQPGLVAAGDLPARRPVPDVEAEYERAKDRGVVFTQEPTRVGAVTTAVFDDTCGNLIQIAAAGD
jgi:hypothetical protein